MTTRDVNLASADAQDTSQRPAGEARDDSAECATCMPARGAMVAILVAVVVAAVLLGLWRHMQSSAAEPGVPPGADKLAGAEEPAAAGAAAAKEDAVERLERQLEEARAATREAQEGMMAARAEAVAAQEMAAAARELAAATQAQMAALEAEYERVRRELAEADDLIERLSQSELMRELQDLESRSELHRGIISDLMRSLETLLDATRTSLQRRQQAAFARGQSFADFARAVEAHGIDVGLYAEAQHRITISLYRLDEPVSGAQYMHEAFWQRLRGDVATAIHKAGEALEAAPDLAAAYVLRGELRVEVGDLGRAVADFERAIELEPSNALAHYFRGQALLHMGNRDLARASVDRAVELDEECAPAHVLRGMLNAMDEEFEAALADFDRAVALQERHWRAWVQRGLLLGHRMERYEEAVESMRQALQHCDDDEARHFIREDIRLFERRLSE